MAIAGDRAQWAVRVPLAASSPFGATVAFVGTGYCA
jgi:hypothetical protein